MKELAKNISPVIQTINGRSWEFSRVNGLWQAKPFDLSGSTGQCSGGVYESMEDYIASIRRSVLYNDAFHSNGGDRHEAKKAVNT